jgi:cytochrome c-type biogenesis protein
MGSELLTTGSVVAAFFAGGVALFAPCCIVFLAPSYLASAAKNNRWRLLPLTFVFAGGLALVLVPITLGMSLIAGAIARYHQPIYYAGGLLMIALAALALSGRMWSLPSALRAPDTSRGDTASFFSLGVFSGIASSCCAPVLAGVMTLSALSGSAVGGVTLGIAYVFGMSFPLFVMALIWDKARLGQRGFLRARAITLRLGARSLTTSTVNLAVAVAFLIMGVFVILLAGSETMTGGTEAQAWASTALTTTFVHIQTFLSPVPEWIQGIGLLAVVVVFVWAMLRDRTPRASTIEVDSCCSPDHDANHDANNPDAVPATNNKEQR